MFAHGYFLGGDLGGTALMGCSERLHDLARSAQDDCQVGVFLQSLRRAFEHDSGRVVAA